MITSTINNFVAAINSHFVNNIIALMTDDHKFIDSFGIELSGKDALKRAWTEYFRMFPDYKMVIDEILISGSNAAIIGNAYGTYTKDGKLKPDNKWQVPAAWYAVTENNKIKTWRIYADVTPIVKILGENN